MGGGWWMDSEWKMVDSGWTVDEWKGGIWWMVDSGWWMNSEWGMGGRWWIVDG